MERRVWVSLLLFGREGGREGEGRFPVVVAVADVENEGGGGGDGNRLEGGGGVERFQILFVVSNAALIA